MNAPMVIQQHSVPDIERMARGIAASKLFGVTNPEQALALCLVAQAEGRHPASAANDYHIIQGKPSKKADAMHRDFIANGGKVEWHKLDDTIVDATFSHPAGGSVRIAWDMKRAQTAGLKTDMWRKYPRQMLRARVVSEGVRTVFPMATSGMYVPEEVQEFAAEQPRDVTPTPVVEQAQLPAPAEEEIKPQPKAKSRELFGEMVEEMRACQTVEELSILWTSAAFKKAFKSLPLDWQTGENSITAEKDTIKADLMAASQPQTYVAPNFDVGPDDSHPKAQFKRSIRLEEAAAKLGAETTPEGLKAAWDAHVDGRFDGEAFDQLAIIYEAALQHMGAGAP